MALTLPKCCMPQISSGGFLAVRKPALTTGRLVSRTKARDFQRISQCAMRLEMKLRIYSRRRVLSGLIQTDMMPVNRVVPSDRVSDDDPRSAVFRSASTT